MSRHVPETSGYRSGASGSQEPLEPRCRQERGSVAILVATASLLFSLFALAAADLGSMLVVRARAQSAADAAALAAVVQQAPVLEQGDDPEGAAGEVAEANGATLVSCGCEVGDTEATVVVEMVPRLAFVKGWFGRVVRATARAEIDADVLTYTDGGSAGG